ncbi:3-oxoacyl-[acyl-carrier-protein] synthase [Quaeritorhiza haematococci]|nr:3-oxoacyl-[acyl-carrier-protein] synthase [Quaeritorhiza haematococci]
MALRKEGIPMEGVCVAAGVPSLDVANEVIGNLKEAGLRHVAFKPGAVETIRRVIQIAKSNPDMSIILQWTGGRGGGHHSFEDFHQPMLETYGAIRRCDNIVLVVGSGFGDAKGTLPYLTGEWSVRFDYAPMPFDGVLFGSRVMVAKEALTSPAVKDLIVQAPGIEDESMWERTYKGDIGGVITVKSELGEPIHKIANRGIKLWREIDDTILSLPREKRLPALLAKKDYFIERLNEDYQKPWFGKKSDGRAGDLHEMTYKEVGERLFELLYIKHKKEWVDVTLRDVVGDFLRRLEERFTKKATISLIQSYGTLDHEPETFIAGFLEAFPEAAVQTLTTEDVLHFVSICSYPWRKPVPFIPRFDERFEFWFKKDSLWQSENLDAIVDQDPQRVAILQGPVAVRHSTKADEPIKEILDNIYNEQIQDIKSLYYGGVDDNIPVAEYLGSQPTVHTWRTPRGVSVTELKDGKERSYVYELSRLQSDLPAQSEWLEYVAGPKYTWLRALLCSDSIVQGKLLIPNPVAKILRPRASQTVFVSYNVANQPQVLTVYNQSTRGQIPSRHPAVVISVEKDVITCTLFNKRDQEYIPLKFFFRYHRHQGYNPIHEVMEGRNQRIKDFYGALWHVNVTDTNLTPQDTFRCSFKVEPSRVAEFVHVIGNQAEEYVGQGENKIAPMDFAIVSGWRALVTAILPKEIDGDLLRLVHLSNEFRQIDNTEVFVAGDVVETEATINAVVINEIGKHVEVKGILSKNGRPLTEIISQFLYRGKFTDYENTFQRTVEKPIQVVLASKKEVAVLQSKQWVRWNGKLETELQPSSTLIFRLETYTRFKKPTVFSELRTTGSIWLKTTRETFQIGMVDYKATDAHGNIVLAYLNRHGKPIEQEIRLADGGYSILPDRKVYPASVTVPRSNDAYSIASGDLNPIHTNPYFADLAGLPGTITHGMWTSASSRRFVEIFAANNRPRRVKSYKVSFVSMVLPGDELETKLYHVGMSNGKKLIKIETFNQNGTRVLEGSAEVEQPPTAYVFTGQGSQEVGMGMDLYNSSPVAKEIWDRADVHMLNTYGVSIIDIVRNNPKSKTIYFGGTRGARMRQHYMSMTYDIMENGRLKSLPLFPDITENTNCFTFSHPNGLLSATQFTQPALTLMEIANFQDMKANGLVQQDCAFAGHSLGEYAGLAAVGEVLSVENLVDVVFYRGMTMQVAVPRDSEGRSQYGMCAVNPLRVSPTFGEQGLKFVVSTIVRRTKGRLLEIVNFNVENLQYVVAGESLNLDVLRLVLNKIKALNLNFIELARTKTAQEIEDTLQGFVDEALATAQKRLEANGYLVQERGLATIPLAGIDVPFHSSFLLNGVVPFREILRKNLEARLINVRLLTKRYIPNLTAVPFSTEKEYVEMVYKQTGSTWLKEVLDAWTENPEKYSTPTGKQEIGHILLIELLCYQFASPVRWIETQDQLFAEYQVERLIEVGPAPVLCNMAQRTLKMKYETRDDAVTQRRTQLCISKDRKDIYYDFEDEVSDSTGDDSKNDAPANSATAAPVAAPVQQQVVAATKSAAPVTDEPVSAQEILIVLIANKLKKPLSDITLSKTIKDLVGGKSTLQNEILGDLAGEFGNVLQDKAEETPLSEVASVLQNSHSGSLGKVSTGLINKLVSGKMPAGFGMSQVKSFLSSTHGLGPKRSEGALLHALTMEPPSRFGNESDAITWLDSVTRSYATKLGITLGGAGDGAGSGAGAGPAVLAINSEEFNMLKSRIDKLIYRQLEQFAKYLDIDLLEGAKKAAAEAEGIVSLQSELDLWRTEHGDFYAEGIKPAFAKQKARIFDSHWNWARQDALQIYYDIIFGRITNVDRELMNRCVQLINRADNQESFIAFLEYYYEHSPEGKDEAYQRLKSLSKVLIQNIKEAIKSNPVYKNEVAYQPTKPKTYIDKNGKLTYCEERRASKNMKDYVKEMRAGSHLTTISAKHGLTSELEELLKLVKISTQPTSEMKHKVDTIFSKIKTQLASSTFKGNLPFVHLKARHPKNPQAWEADAELTKLYLDCLESISSDGITFSGRHVLVMGAGKGSIGLEVLKCLLQGGARIVVTTSSFSKEVVDHYQHIYTQFGSKGSRLVVVPFNGASLTDVKALVDYIYHKDPKSGLNWDLDAVIPFAAIPEPGREIDNIDSRSELSHRLMLTNLLRLLGEIKLKKQANGYDTRPAAVLLPMSPNHGTFGGDGLYGESKIALETLLNRFRSESWGAYLTIIGATIGWTRGTGLMSANNIVAEGIESLGARTFSSVEMAFNLIGLLHPKIVKLSESEPVWSDLNGGLQFVKDLNTIVYDLRKQLFETSEIRRAVHEEAKLDNLILYGPAQQQTSIVTPRANMKFSFPSLKTQKLNHLRGMLDLEKVVVVTGFGEVGPWGSSRTRWEMESYGEFSLEGCIEMAWMMGFIKFHNGPLKKMPNYSGWIDVKTQEPVQDLEIKAKYEKEILEHSGIRFIEPQLFNEYDPNQKLFLQEVAVTHDMPPLEVSEEEAKAFKLRNGDKCDIQHKNDQWFVTIKKGATLYIPKALRFDRLVAAQIPTGWDASRYGVPDDIIKQVDPVTLFVLVSTVEALITSGVTDPYEFYEYVHVSEVGNTSGGGMGGMRAMQKIFKERLLEKPVQNDILQESFINTMPAWINMLLLSSSGPIKTPVGACATAAESVEIAVETILSGKAKVVFCGGYDDFQEEGSYEFANMKATSNSVEEFAMGREPREMCRPCTDTRGGFMEGQGAGIHVLMTGALAVKMGVPIRGIVACTNTATDKNGRSVPAPGQGILTTAREQPGKYPSPLLKLEYRKKQLNREREHIKQWIQMQYEALSDEVEEIKQAGGEVDQEFINERTAFIEKEGKRKEKAALASWSHDWWKNDSTISALRGSLAMFGLTIDDIGVASFHGTGTKANDYNESSVLNQQMEHLGRTKGNIVPCVFQKHLTGHPKGAAAAWMLNGVLQVLETGIVPGNRNLDNVEERLGKFSYLLYPSCTIQTDGIKAGILKSFGFGQAGGEVLVIHPDYLFAALEESEFNQYLQRREVRQTASYQYYHQMLTGTAPFVRVKNAAPYTAAQQSKVYLNPLARASYDKRAGSWGFQSAGLAKVSPKPDLDVTKNLLDISPSSKGIGLDVQLISEVNVANDLFVKRNFTNAEVDYCAKQANPQESFAGRWAAKEAVIKAVSSAAGDQIVWDKGSGAPLNDVEILREEGKAPVVKFHGGAKEAVSKVGLKEVKVTISHSGSYAIAMAAAV